MTYEGGFLDLSKKKFVCGVVAEQKARRQAEILPTSE
jgi:hypothetical protein